MKISSSNCYDKPLISYTNIYYVKFLFSCSQIFSTLAQHITEWTTHKKKKKKKWIFYKWNPNEYFIFLTATINLLCLKLIRFITSNVSRSQTLPTLTRKQPSKHQKPSWNEEFPLSGTTSARMIRPKKLIPSRSHGLSSGDTRRGVVHPLESSKHRCRMNGNARREVGEKKVLVVWRVGLGKIGRPDKRRALCTLLIPRPRNWPIFRPSNRAD